jgi:NAD(P)-dependent dehydrogenase (short-subunit alcohol dehydrogenase family)
MANTPKTVIVTGGSQGIGSGAVKAFLDRDYNVVATSRNVTKSTDLPSSPKLALVDGDIGDATTAARVTETAIRTFGSIDALVNNAGIFFTKPFTDYTAEDFKRLVSTCAVTRRRFSSGCKTHPATAPAGSNRGRHGGDEMSEAPG